MVNSPEVLTDRIETFRVSPTLKLKLQELAIKNRRKLNDYVRILLEDAVDSAEKKKK